MIRRTACALRSCCSGAVILARSVATGSIGEDGVGGLMEDTDQSDYGPTWFSRVTSLPPPRNTLNYEIDVDVCVIGGGLAGLTVAREIVRRGWSVAVLEGAR